MEDTLEQLELCSEANILLQDAVESLKATLVTIKTMAERTDVPAGDMLYNVSCEANAALESAPDFTGGPLEDEEKEAPAHLWVILTGNARQDQGNGE